MIPGFPAAATPKTHQPQRQGRSERTNRIYEQLDQLRLEKQNIPSAARSKVNIRFRNYSSDIDEVKRKLKSLSDDRKALFGERYTDEPQDEHLEQRQQLLSGTERLERSSARLQNSQRIALETEDVARGTLADLEIQRGTIQNTRDNLQQSEGYVDTSIKTLRGMARRYRFPFLSSRLPLDSVYLVEHVG